MACRTVAFPVKSSHTLVQYRVPTFTPSSVAEGLLSRIGGAGFRVPGLCCVEVVGRGVGVEVVGRGVGVEVVGRDVGVEVVGRGVGVEALTAVEATWFDSTRCVVRDVTLKKGTTFSAGAGGRPCSGIWICGWCLPPLLPFLPDLD